MKLTFVSVSLLGIIQQIGLQRPFCLSTSLGFHGPPLSTFETDRLDIRGLDRG